MGFFEDAGWSLMTYVTDFAVVAFFIMIVPFGWSVLLGALLLGGTRQPWWSTLLLAAGSTMCGVTLLYLWLARPGIRTSLPAWLDLLALYLFFCVICIVGWLLGRAAAWLVRKAGPPVMTNTEEAS